MELNRQYYSSITFWNEDYINESELTIIRYIGDAENIQSNKIIQGTIPVGYDNRKSSNMCAVSTSYAYELWGSMDGVGKLLTDEKNNIGHMVTAIFENKSNIVYVYTTNSDKTFSQLELSGFNRFDLDVDESMKHQDIIPNAANRINYGLLSVINIQISQLPFVLLCILLFVRIIQEHIKDTRYQFSLFNICVFILVYFALIIYICNSNYSLSEDFIPTKWSNSNFWTQMMKEVTGQYKALFNSSPNIKVIEFRRKIYLIGVLSMMASLSTAFVLFNYYINSFQRLICITNLSILITGLICVQLIYIMPIIPNRFIWGYPILLYVSRYFVTHISTDPNKNTASVKRDSPAFEEDNHQ